MQERVWLDDKYMQLMISMGMPHFIHFGIE